MWVIVMRYWWQRQWRPTLVYCVRRYYEQRGWMSKRIHRRGWSACRRAGRSPRTPKSPFSFRWRWWSSLWWQWSWQRYFCCCWWWYVFVCYCWWWDGERHLFPTITVPFAVQEVSWENREVGNISQRNSKFAILRQKYQHWFSPIGWYNFV